MYYTACVPILCYCTVRISYIIIHLKYFEQWIISTNLSLQYFVYGLTIKSFYIFHNSMYCCACAQSFNFIRDQSTILYYIVSVPHYNMYILACIYIYIFHYRPLGSAPLLTPGLPVNVS